jgi:RNA polymerase-binding transcription factor DksA
LNNYQCLPVNKKCANKWRENPEHLKNCACLETEAQESYLLFSNSLQKSKEKLKECACETSPKVRISSDNYAWCEKCETSIPVASKKRVIKNRNDPKF